MKFSEREKKEIIKKMEEYIKQNYRMRSRLYDMKEADNMIIASFVLYDDMSSRIVTLCYENEKVGVYNDIF